MCSKCIYATRFFRTYLYSRRGGRVVKKKGTYGTRLFRTYSSRGGRVVNVPATFVYNILFPGGRGVVNWASKHTLLVTVKFLTGFLTIKVSCCNSIGFLVRKIHTRRQFLCTHEVTRKRPTHCADMLLRPRPQ